jgi:hypothetical protein
MGIQEDTLRAASVDAPKTFDDLRKRREVGMDRTALRVQQSLASTAPRIPTQDAQFNTQHVPKRLPDQPEGVIQTSMLATQQPNRVMSHGM